MSHPDFISQANPLCQYLAHREGIDAAIQRVLHKGRYILGEEVEAFEREFARYLNVAHAIGVGSGTAALEIALRACGIGPGDEVITTAHTAVATVAAIELAGATPVLADIEPGSFLLDPAEVEKVISPRTKAIIPVHLYGQPADLSGLLPLAQRHKLRMIEDCAQAHGAIYGDRRVGGWGDLGCFSFYPTKNLGAIGDGGMIVTGSTELAERARSLREYGWQRRYVSAFAGANSRLDELQAAILRVKLPCLDADNQRRLEIARLYSEDLAGCVTVPLVKDSRSHVFHLFVIRTACRDALQEFLGKQGIGCAVHYPAPVHLQPAYLGRLGEAGSFPAAEQAANDILSLPLYPELLASQCQRVIRAIREFFSQDRPGGSA